MFPASLMNSCSKFPVIFYTWTIFGLVGNFTL